MKLWELYTESEVKQLCTEMKLRFSDTWNIQIADVQ